MATRATLRLGILSRRRSLYSTARLVEAAREHGAKTTVINALRCSLVVAKGRSKLLHRGVDLGGLSAVIPRIGASITTYGMAVVSHLESMGVTVINGAQAIAQSRDKVRCLQRLAAGGLEVPKTVLVNGCQSIK